MLLLELYLNFIAFDFTLCIRTKPNGHDTKWFHLVTAVRLDTFSKKYYDIRLLWGRVTLSFGIEKKVSMDDLDWKSIKNPFKN